MSGNAWAGASGNFVGKCCFYSNSSDGIYGAIRMLGRFSVAAVLARRD